MAASAVFLILVAARNPRAWSRLLLSPQGFSRGSAEVVLRYDVFPLLLAAGLTAAAWGLGKRILRLILADEARDMPPLLFHCASYAMGMGLIAYFFFILGLSDMLRGPGLFLTAAACLAFGGVEALGLALRLIRRRRTPKLRPIALWKGALAGLLAYAAWHALVAALAPPTAFDVLTDHLALAKIYLRSGGIHEIPWMIFSHWPHLMECLYVLPLRFGADNVPALLHAASSAALVLAAYAAAEEFTGDARGAWIAAAIVAAQPSLLYYAGTAKIDGTFALFFFLSCVCAWIWSPTGSRRGLALAGLLCGLAASTKLHGLFLLGLLAFWITLRAALSKKSGAWKGPALFLACGLLPVLPWYAKTLLGTGNPVWPFFSKALGGRWGASAIEPIYIRAGSWLYFSNLLDLWRREPQYMLVPAALLAFLGFARRLTWPRFLTRFLLPLSLPYFLLVFRLNPFWRFMLPFFPAFAIAMGWAASRLLASRGPARAVSLAALAFGLSPMAAMNQSSRLLAVLGWSPSPDKDSRTAYLEENLDHYRIFQTANRILGPSSKVLLFRESRGYYLDADYMWGDPSYQALIEYSAMKNGDDLPARLRQLGITHVFVNAGNPMFYESPDVYSRSVMDLMRDMLEKRAVPVLRDGPMALFELKKPG